MRAILFNQITSLGSARGLGHGISKVASAAPASGGSGYKKGDLITLAGGTMPIAPQMRVTAVDGGGAVTALENYNAGAATTKPSNPASTTSGSGSGLTLTVTWSDNAVPDGVTCVRVTGEAQTVRWRDDGVAPSATVGHPLAAGSTVEFGYLGPNPSNVKLIEATSGGIVNVSYYAA